MYLVAMATRYNTSNGLEIQIVANTGNSDFVFTGIWKTHCMFILNILIRMNIQDKMSSCSYVSPLMAILFKKTWYSTLDMPVAMAMWTRDKMAFLNLVDAEVIVHFPIIIRTSKLWRLCKFVCVNLYLENVI